jgi:hypothetical protein
MNLPTLSDEQTKALKSFWERPEGTTGMVFLALAGLGLYFALPTLLSFMGMLVTLLGQTIAVTILCAILAAILFIVTNKQFLTLCRYAFKSAMRAVTGWFVEIDPIGIMKSYVEDMQEKRAVMAGARDKLKGQLLVLRRKISENKTKYENAMATAKLAQDKGMQAAFSINARQAGRLQKLNDASFIPLAGQLEVHLRAINKYYEVTGTVIEDLKNEVEARQQEREMIMSSYSAMSAAKKILKGGTDQKEMFDQAMEYVVNDFGQKLAEVDSFIQSSKGFVDGLDLQNGVYEAEALKRLQDWEQKADSILLGEAGKAQLLENTSAPSALIGAPVTADYSALLKD